VRTAFWRLGSAVRTELDLQACAEDAPHQSHAKSFLSCYSVELAANR
jgi:hypothetical protein